MNAFSGPLPQHFDVLGARPEAAEEKARLVEELRTRGNAAFKRGALDEAEVLYGRAIEVDEGRQAALLGNRAAARIGMQRFELALEDADAAVKADGAWAKGWFRKGQALAGLKRWAEAKAAFAKTLELEPANKDAQKQMEEAGGKAASKPAAAAPTTTTTTAAPKKQQQQPAAPARREKEEEEEDDDDGKDMRGYKVLADGRKTTFFHREIPQEEKERLAAANKPQPLAPSGSNGASSAPSSSSGPTPLSNGGTAAAGKKDGSVWNAAGTFEERDYTQWAQDKIKELVVGTNTMCDVNNSADMVLVEATGVSSFEGGASVSYIRGSKRFPFDFTFDVDWSCDLEDGTSIKGKVFVSEFTSEFEDVQTELRWEGRERAGKHVTTLLAHLKKDFTQALVAKLKAFVVEFKAL